MTAILRLTTLRWGALALILLALFLAASPLAAYAQDEGGCADSIDNDGDGFINDGCPAVGEPEATAAPTDEPTAAPTDEPTATDPATQEPTEAPTIAPTAAPTDDPTPTATPATVPPTGGPPGQDGDGGTTGENPQDPQFSEWLAQTGAIGIVTSFLVLLVSVLGLGRWVTPTVKRITAIVLSITLTVVYIAIRDNLEIASVEDVFATVLGVLVTSQVAYLLVSKEVETRVMANRQE